MERIWPGARPHVEVLGGGSQINFKVTSTTAPRASCRRQGHGASASTAASNTRHRSLRPPLAWADVVAFIEPEGYLVTRFVGGRSWIDALREPEALRRIASRFVRSTTGRRSWRGSTCSGRRGLRRHGATHGGRSPPGTTSRSRRPLVSSAPAVPLPSAHVTTTCSPPTSSTTARGSGSWTGVRGYGRRLLRPGELRRQQRPVEGRDRRAVVPTSVTCVRSTCGRWR